MAGKACHVLAYTTQVGLIQALGPVGNIDALERNIRAISTDPVVLGAAEMLSAWKSSASTADELGSALERYLGTAWIERDEDHAQVYALWSAFRQDAIDPIRGMTVNERLYWFGLLEQFDAAHSETDKQALYKKLHAGA